MPVQLPPDTALAEFLGPTTRHTRRIEIYEQDGITRWSKDDGRSRLKSGSVSVDYDRDERRSIDLVLNNSDGALINAPGEFWYDKIIKVFRGVEILGKDRPPKILVIADGGDNTGIPQAFREAMSAKGFGDIRINPLATSVADLIGYEIIVGINSTNSVRNQLLEDAYALGYAVITLGTTTVANFGTDVFGSGATDETVTFTSSSQIIKPISASHQISTGWTPFFLTSLGEDDFDADLPVVATPPDDFVTVAETDDGEQLISVKDSGNRKWIMFHGPIYADIFTQPQFRNFLATAFGYLNPVSTLDSWETQIGEFMIDRISESHFPHEMKITGRDYAKKCLNSKYLHATQFDAGEVLDEVISSIAGAAGIVKRLIPSTGIEIGRDFYFDADTSRWAAMKELATAYNYELFFDATGYLVMRPYHDPATSSPSITLQTGREGQLASYDKSTSDTSIYNVIIVLGESSDSDVLPVYAVARNDDLDSPTSTIELGERVYRYSSSFIETEEQAQELADSWLAIYAMEDFELSFESLMLPWLEVGDIIGWVDPNPAPGDPSSFLLSTLTIPLTLEPMSGSAKRMTVVS